jgi:hypothetical protein
MFSKHAISCGSDVPWPYLIWWYRKSKVFMSKPRTIEELKQRINEEIAPIPEQMSHRVMKNLRKSLGSV